MSEHEAPYPLVAGSARDPWLVQGVVWPGECFVGDSAAGGQTLVAQSSPPRPATLAGGWLGQARPALMWPKALIPFRPAACPTGGPWWWLGEQSEGEFVVGWFGATLLGTGRWHERLTAAKALVRRLGRIYGGVNSHTLLLQLLVLVFFRVFLSFATGTRPFAKFLGWWLPSRGSYLAWFRSRAGPGRGLQLVNGILATPWRFPRSSSPPCSTA